MKKIIYFFLFAALPSAIHAWIVKTGAQTSTVIVEAANMRNYYQADSTNYYIRTGMWTYSGGVSVGCGSGYVYRFKNVKPSLTTTQSSVTGFFVGTTFENSNSPKQYDLCIGTENYFDRLVTKVTINFVTIGGNADAKPFIKKHLGRTTYDIFYSVNGDYWGQATIEPYLPISNVPVTCKANFLNNNNVPPQIFNRKASGCLITDITVEYIDKGKETNALNYHSHLTPELKIIGMNGNYSSQAATLVEHRNTLLNKHYANTVASDVNADGTVNTADVTSVYKAIDSGDGEIEGIPYVDLGLPSGRLWAAMNYGAIVPEDFGDFYMSASTMGFLSHKISSFSSKYYNEYKHWEAPQPWTTPTLKDANELLNNCTATKTYINGVYCLVLTSTINGNKLILPATAGDVDENGYHSDADYAQYWTCTERTSNPNMLRTIEISPYESNNSIDTDNGMYYYSGCYLRLVCSRRK